MKIYIYINIPILFTLALLSGCASEDLIESKGSPTVDKSQIVIKSVPTNDKNQSELSNLSIADINLIESNNFLAKNRKYQDVVETSTGLQYKKLTQGHGCNPNPNSQVTVHYESRLVSSTIPFDSSYQRRVPGTYSLKQMILAWEEGIPLMREGDIWEFYVPPHLAYGLKGAPPVIGPNVITIYKIELIKSGLCK